MGPGTGIGTPAAVSSGPDGKDMGKTDRAGGKAKGPLHAQMTKYQTKAPTAISWCFFHAARNEGTYEKAKLTV